MKYEKCKVVMLPTEKASQFTIFKSEYGLFRGSSIDIEDFNEGDKSYQPQHLYFLSHEHLPYDDKIFDDGAFFHIDPAGERHIITKDTFKPNPNFCKRIISSTDGSLGLARPSNEFLKKYCELGGIDEVLVEYEFYSASSRNREKVGKRLKVAPDNTITIKPVKDSFSLEEVIGFINKYHKDTNASGNAKLDAILDKQKEEWIKEHLL